jgi:hypothetical protein
MKTHRSSKHTSLCKDRLGETWWVVYLRRNALSQKVSHRDSEAIELMI